MSELHAAYGLICLENLEKIIHHNYHIKDLYLEKFKNIQEVRIQI